MDEQSKKPFKWCFGLLKIFGLWLDGEESKRYRRYGIFLFFFCPILLSSLQTAGIFERGLSIDSVESLTFIIAGVVLIIRIIDLLVKFQSFKDLYDNLDEATKKYIRNGKFIRKRMRFCFKLFIVMEVNVVMNIASACFISLQAQKLPHQVGVPFDIENNRLGFWIVYFYECIALIYVPPVFNAMIVLPVFFMNFLIGFMEDYNERLKNFGNPGKLIKNGKDLELENNRIHEELKELVQTHGKIKYLADEISKLFSITFFVASIVGSVLLCSSVFVIPLVRKLPFKI